MNKKIAITGADGFIGTHLKKRLAKEKISFSTFDKKKDNLEKPESLQNFLAHSDVVVHLAGANRDISMNILKTNILGTSGLLEGMKLYAPNSRIIFASSFAVYDENSLYGLSKRLAEEVIEYYSKSSLLQGTIFRIANVYGPHGRPFYNSVVATFAHLIKNNKPISVNGDGTDKRDYIYIEDVVDAIVKAINYKQESDFKIFDICSEKQTQLKELISVLQSLTQDKIRTNYNSQNTQQGVIIKKTYKEALKYLSWQPTTMLAQGLKNVLNDETKS